MRQDLTLSGWRARLMSQGHLVTDPRQPTPTGFTLWPDPDTIVTVAVEPDPTLRRKYRQRFFACEPEPEQVFRVTGCPEPHRGCWLELVSRQPPGCWRDFLAGPGSWTLSRLARYRAVVFWTEAGLEWDDLDNTTYREWGMAVPLGAAPFFAAPEGAASHSPRLVPVSDWRFADTVAACFLVASVGWHDCYLADEEGTEVYLAHHHEKVVVSVPAAGTRVELVRELAGASWLFTDVSGYASSTDRDGQCDVSGG